MEYTQLTIFDLEPELTENDNMRLMIERQKINFNFKINYGTFAQIRDDFSDERHFKRLEKNIKSCFFCGHDFRDDEQIHMITIKEREDFSWRNIRYICKSCRRKAEKLNPKKYDD